MSYFLLLENDWVDLPSLESFTGPEGFEAWLDKEVAERYIAQKNAEEFRAVLASLALMPRAGGTLANLVYVPDARVAPVTLDLREKLAQGDEEEAIASEILVAPDERGPHDYEVLEFDEDVTIYRSIGAMVTSDTLADGGLPLMMFHGMRFGPVDIIASTWLGGAIDLVEEVSEAVEKLLVTMSYEF